ncbi:MAG: hypothetical protein M3O24_01460 [Thermoproteota archaeon]|nr:hypothetical protein [Thermoproteota archaeon]
MNHRIPPQIIDQVLHLSLSGLSTRAISRSVGISVGSVFSMIQEFEISDKDYHLLRTLAVNLHKKGLDVFEYAWLVRLGNVIQNSGLTRKQVEEVITELPVHCYKAGISIEILVDQLKMFKNYLEANSTDPVQANLIVESYNKSIEYYKSFLQKHEMDSQTDETDNEEKLKNVLEFILTDDKIQELNEGSLVELTKQEILERIIDVIRNPSSYEDLFFGSTKIASSTSFQI